MILNLGYGSKNYRIDLLLMKQKKKLSHWQFCKSLFGCFMAMMSSLSVGK